MKDNRTCFCCGNKYSYCPSCANDVNKPSWYLMFCSEECKEVNATLSQYTYKKINIKDAKALLNNVNVSNYKNEINKNCILEISKYKATDGLKDVQVTKPSKKSEKEDK